MNQELIQNAEKYKKRQGQKKFWVKLVSIFGCFVVFCTAYALILPAITQERDTFCNIEAHTHEEACYTQLSDTQQSLLVCSYDSLQVHTHSDTCFDAEGHVLCGQADYVVHQHDSACFNEDGNLICTLPEASQHVHTEECYASQKTQTPICGQVEETAHTHGSDCYTASETLLCTIAEAHSHSDACYADGELICTEPEGHTHTASCYEQVLQCQLSETPGHTHTESCYTSDSEEILICTEPTAEVHIHSAACYTEATPQTLTCSKTEDASHSHTALCYGVWELTCDLEEHTHELICYSDPTADLETAEQWEASFADVELTGVWADDVLAIAESQLGYHESTKNYTVKENSETIKGYTRYGAWYGDPYGDWCAMFVSFCLHYAEVEDMPLHSNCQKWIEALSEERIDRYRAEEDYAFQSGDLVFFDTDEDDVADHIGLFYALIEETATEPAKMKTIEGNSSDCVQYVTYDLEDPSILVFGDLPEAPVKDAAEDQTESETYFCEQNIHTHTADCFDAEENLICTLPEHEHTTVCSVDLRDLSDEDRSRVELTILAIDGMPSADEIDARIEEFEETEDYEGEEAWLTMVYQQVAQVYQQYSALPAVLQERVVNRDKLLELEYIWSAVTLETVEIAETISYSASIFTDDARFVVYTQNGNQ